VNTVEVSLIHDNNLVYPKCHPSVCYVSLEDSYTRPKAKPWGFDFETDMKRLEKEIGFCKSFPQAESRFV
jgi:hypothetical protein